MNKNETLSLAALPIVVLFGAGLAWAGSRGGVAVNGIPVFALCVALAFAVQWIAFIPAAALKTEKFYDLTGSLTYLAVTFTGLALSRPVDARGLLLAALVATWALRLGVFLFGRIRAAGEDRRFREIKTSRPRFLLAWTLQGLWIAFTLAAALAAITAGTRAELGGFALAGTLAWALGFGIEVAADGQKRRFGADPANAGKFIRTGLWAWSRHPNYFGEIVLWAGVALIAYPVLQGWGRLTLLSPVFVWLLLTRVSGVPILEARADEKWGGEADYEAYKAQTPVLVPRPPAKNQ
ncbi:MAG TPA: DUF1295 domain-containing protein [Anaerolineales bacterium]|nr:DUF1295 domain-containing protein [Anaerolineales bacterium]